MTRKTIGELPAASTPLAGTEKVELENAAGTASQRCTTQDIADLGGAFTPPAGSGLTATTVGGAVEELGDRDFQVKLEDFVPVGGTSFGGGGLNSLGMTFAVGGSTSVFFPTGAQSLLLDAIAVEMSTAGSTDSNASVRAFQTLSGLFRRCSGSPLNGGFIVDQLFGFRLAGSRADQRAFFGLRGTTGDFSAGQEPSAITNMIGIAKDTGDTNLMLMHNDASGTATKVDLGVAFTTIIGKLLRLRLVAPVGGTTITYDLHNIDDDVHYTGTVSTNLIPADTAVYQSGYVNTGAITGVTVAARVAKFTQFRNYV